MKDDTLMLLRLGLKLGAIDHRAFERGLQALERAPAGSVPPTRRLVQAGILADASLAALWSEEQLRGHVAFGQLDGAQAATIRALRKAHESYIEDEDDLSPIAVGPDLEPTMAQELVRPLAPIPTPVEFHEVASLMADEGAPELAQEVAHPFTSAHGFVPDPSSHESGMVVSLGASLTAEPVGDGAEEVDESTLFFDAPFDKKAAPPRVPAAPPRAPTAPPPRAAATPPAPPPEEPAESGAGEDEATLFFDAPMAKSAPKAPTPTVSTSKGPPPRAPAPQAPTPSTPTKPPATAPAPAHEEGEANEDEATLFFDSPILPGALKPPRPTPAAAAPADDDGDLAPLEPDEFEAAATVVADDAIMAQIVRKSPPPAKTPPAKTPPTKAPVAKAPPPDLEDDDTLAPIDSGDIENAATIVADDESVRRLMKSMRPAPATPLPDLDDEETLAPMARPVTDDFGAAATVVADEDTVRELVKAAKPATPPDADDELSELDTHRAEDFEDDRDPLDDTEDSVPAIRDDDLEGTVKRASPVVDSGEDDAEVATIVPDSQADDDDALDAIAFTPPPRREPTFNEEAPTFLSLKPDAARAAVPSEPPSKGATTPISRPPSVPATPKAPATSGATTPAVPFAKPPTAPTTPAAPTFKPPAAAPTFKPPTAAPTFKPPTSAGTAPTFKPPAPPAAASPSATSTPPRPAPPAPAPVFQPARPVAPSGQSTSVVTSHAAPARATPPRGGRVGRFFSALFLVGLCAAMYALYHMALENRRLAEQLDQGTGSGSTRTPDVPPKSTPPKDPVRPSDTMSAVLALAESIGRPLEADRAAKAFELDLRLFHWATEWCAHERTTELSVLERQARHLSLAWSEQAQAVAVLDAARSRGLSLTPAGVWLDAYLRDRLGQRDLAAQGLAALAKSADPAWSALAKAEQARAKGQVDVASKALADAPDAIARLQLARMLRHAGRAKAAEAGLDALIAAHPLFAAAQIERAFARLEQGDLAPARAIAPEGGAPLNDPHAEILAARLELAVGQSSKAVARLARIVGEHPGIGEAHAAHADALAKEDRKAEADAARKRAVELEPALQR